MSQTAFSFDGLPIDASSVSSQQWENMKALSQLGDYFMPCCGATAVLKTSINGLHFFAHSANECATAPETKWHKQGKAAVLAALFNLGIDGRQEVKSKPTDKNGWQADVYFNILNRNIAVELQRSYQHLRDYTRRQQRYEQAGVECYWLLPKDNFLTLAKATSRLRLIRDFGNKFPEGGIGTGMLPELPIAMLTMDDENVVQFGGFKTATVSEWIQSIIAGSYMFRNGSWNLH
ncbi:hypothetical protein C4565_05125 [Candidatus Parcubacteria bacterium]|nr:MAG: hypothetical protein C4565_05125 [Candidatus Parcubacteria bacterium]